VHSNAEKTLEWNPRNAGLLMRTIGFSTGALAERYYRRALQMLAHKPVNAVELSALRQDELQP
jgi:hypothetical protein